MDGDSKEQGFEGNRWRWMALEIKAKQEELRKIKPEHNLLSLVVVGNVERGEIVPNKEFENNYLSTNWSNVEGYQKYLNHLIEAIKN